MERVDNLYFKEPPQRRPQLKQSAPPRMNCYHLLGAWPTEYGCNFSFLQGFSCFGDYSAPRLNAMWYIATSRPMAPVRKLDELKRNLAHLQVRMETVDKKEKQKATG